MHRKKFLASTITAGVTSLVFATTALASTTTTYVSHENDTFWSLSKKYHVSVSALEAANPHVSPQNIYSGLKLQIPTTAAQTAGNRVVAPKVKPAHSFKFHGKQEVFSKEVTCVATAYTASESANPWGAVDSLGHALKLGTIAVDPKVIPLGSTLYVTGYNFRGLPTDGMIFRATDTGGAIKGNRVDVFIPTSHSNAMNFGRQTVKVYVLK